ncbi:hypothetical protein NDU88_000232 [Pleurodeles waltl]|uniref:Uncharacterized protein n=1 Tax=Pleurodeles waltl TaxID=8319 RepID=A0AAV7P545_PLEWA|nr:hypothetical protein NDU88_000232 [Pleurodeles waltl]
MRPNSQRSPSRPSPAALPPACAGAEATSSLSRLWGYSGSCDKLCLCSTSVCLSGKNKYPGFSRVISAKEFKETNQTAALRYSILLKKTLGMVLILDSTIFTILCSDDKGT